MIHALEAIGPLAALGIAVGSKILGGLGGNKGQQASPAYTALEEIRRRRLEELQRIQQFQNQFLGQPPTLQPTESQPGTPAAGGLLALLDQLRGRYGQ